MRKALLATSLFAGFALALPAVTFAQAPASGASAPANGGLATNPAAKPPFSEHASNLSTSTITSPIAPALPSANLGPNATSAQYLDVAQKALAQGKTGLAQESLENAETLALTRSIPYTTNATGPHALDGSPLVKNIQQALQALGRGDIPTAQHFTSLASQEAAS